MEAAREKPRWGYRRLQLKLEEQGMHVNHKKVYRVYRGKRGALLLRREKAERLLRAGAARDGGDGESEPGVGLGFVHDAAESGRNSGC